jgi:hypothetical protein
MRYGYARRYHPYLIAFADKEGILHIARRVFLREVQGREVMPVVFNLRPFGHHKTKAFKNIDDLVTYQRKRVARANLKPSPGRVKSISDFGLAISDVKLSLSRYILLRPVA